MTRYVILILAFFLYACNSNKNTTTDEDEDSGPFNYTRFSNAFTAASTPYQLTDSTVYNNKDTVTLKTLILSGFAPDTVTAKFLGNGNIKYYRQAKISAPNGETYFVIRAEAGKKKSALVAVFDNEKFTTSFPFLLADTDPKTSHVSTIDNSFLMSRIVTRKLPQDVVDETKDVYAYNKDLKQFSLIMIDEMGDRPSEMINPIDTLPRTHKWAGDYVKNKNNIVSVRDGRYENEIRFFIHINKNEGNCIGEIKGTALISSSVTAVYRVGGDPCVLELRFTGNSVALKELDGCGNHRGLNCPFEGSFPKKKQQKTSSSETGSKSANK